jgi:hypothetical protein
MLTKEKLTSLKRRIVKAKSSFSAMGEMILTYEVDAMPIEEKDQLQTFLKEKGVSWNYLDKVIENEMADIEKAYCQKVEREYYNREN